ncbi:MAG: MGMT family protein [Chromatiales bacterium]
MREPALTLVEGSKGQHKRFPVHSPQRGACSSRSALEAPASGAARATMRSSPSAAPPHRAHTRFLKAGRLSCRRQTNAENTQSIAPSLTSPALDPPHHHGALKAASLSDWPRFLSIASPERRFIRPILYFEGAGANPIPILIPCHRVVASGGQLGDFSGRTGGEGVNLNADCCNSNACDGQTREKN